MNSRTSLLSSRNPNSLKSRLARGLLRALMRINKHEQPRSWREIRERRRFIRTAAYGSMASAVGNRRAWSRALLRKIRNQGGAAAVSGSKRRSRMVVDVQQGRLQRGMKIKNRVEVLEEGVDGSGEEVDKLRMLVPGGQVMDTCSLLEETAHYMKCLATQVKVMTRIAEIYNIP